MENLAVIIIMYWHCQWAAVRSMLSENYIIPCTKITEILQREKFDGDWNKYLEWWRANKDKEFADRDRMFEQFEMDDKI